MMAYLQERDHHAVYIDAHVVDIHRRQHDLNSCKCIFVVSYDNDNTEVNSPKKKKKFPIFLSGLTCMCICPVFYLML